MRPHGTHQQLETRRRRAIVMLQAGKPYRTVAATLSASLSSVVRWHQTYQKRGLRGLRPKLNAGRPCRLSEAQKEQLKRILLKGSQAAGYSTDLWTLKRVAEVIHKRFGIRYRSTHVWHVMSAGLKWSWQKPERRAIQRDEEAIARWKKTTWPRIKKSPSAARSPGLPR
ncbi:MAG: winged helix-turn-helix domain-containing protein [Candidatus Rokubacteria bacterium]|nr:winged helix-turn-helix domain-containing protein [Candidatus Rokubacteria bacterium]